MKNRNDFETRYKPGGDRPKEPPRGPRLPSELEEIIEQEEEEWKDFMIDTVQEKGMSCLSSNDEEGDRSIALEMFNRLEMLLPSVVSQYPEDGRLSLQIHALSIEMVVSDRPWFTVQEASAFKLQMLNDDWLIESDGMIVGSELKLAQDFCENMMHIWEQVMLSFEFADRIE